MADHCAHCRGTDVMHGFDTFQCLTCGRITDLAGNKLLPDSLHTAPNHTPALEQYGWPWEDADAAVARGQQVMETQWGTPFPAPTGG